VNAPAWQWWNLEEGDARIVSTLKDMRDTIEKRGNGRRLDMVAMRSIYLDTPHTNYGTLDYTRARKSRYNLTQGAIDSTHAQVVASRPRPKIVTIAQDFGQQRKAQLRQRWIDGEYERTEAYERLSEMALDGLIYGTGVLKVGAEDGRPVVDRVWAGDLYVDPREERYRHTKVRTLYQIHAIDRDVLMLEYPDHAEAIARCECSTRKATDFPDLDEDAEDGTRRNLVPLIEAWRLPTRSKRRRKSVSVGEYVVTGEGRHVLVCDRAVLIDEEWDHPTFPFVVFRWATDPQRWWAQGMVERAAGMQSDLNELTNVIQTAYGVMVPQFWIDDGASVQDLNDVVGRVNRCAPVGKSISDAVMVLSPDVGVGLLNREAEIARRFLPVLGVDALAAQAEKPPGLNSGAALQNFKESVSIRFMPQGRRYEQCTVVLANLLFYFADKLAAAGEDQTVEVFGEDIGLEMVHYEHIKPEGDEVFAVRVQPASALPKDIAGRMQVLYDMQALGVNLDPGWLAKTMELPDVEGAMDAINAPRDLVLQAVEQCKSEDDAQPEANAFWPLMNPDGSPGVALQVLTQQVQLAMFKHAPMSVIERLMRLHGHARGLYDQEKAKLAAPAMPADPAMAGGAPMTAANGPAPGQMPDAPPPDASALPQPPPMIA
jgi:hypothetical protein